ncbi:STM4012 family radical SAM protein [Prosthecobacter sp.]|uniref:STM4012 family radical SAM protein n=1 Tax=Prosthecobacter sp. TaxID=1965333 RepID=UPI00378318A3
MTDIREQVREGGLFQGYAYGYPHKMAYRALSPAVPLREAWAEEPKDALFLYAHVPFCSVRCGFCNLFTVTGQGAAKNRVISYLDSLERQVETLQASLGTEARVARVAIGGGTPTFLTTSELGRLFDLLGSFQRTNADVPLAVEMSPDSVDAEKLALLRERGVTRASVGVQSFVEKDTRALGRPQKAADVERALTAMSDARFPVRNLDLIYGVEGQTWEDWQASLQAALRHEPEEIFLYPLYVRPLTGLGRKDKRPTDAREELYRRGRDFLLSEGYTQISMRLFRSAKHPGECDVHYCCQEDGMVGLGAGARSYTRALHYSKEWAVGRNSVQEILDHYSATQDHGLATYGATLDLGDQKRRYVIKSILRARGLELAAYKSMFQSAAMEDFPQLHMLTEHGAAVLTETHLQPTQLGLEWSDVIGPWLYSAQVKEAIAAFELR